MLLSQQLEIGEIYYAPCQECRMVVKFWIVIGTASS